MKDQVATLLKKEMDRKDFLKYVAAAGFMAVGGGVILQSVGGFEKLGLGGGAKGGSATRSLSYGSSAYGGQSRG